MIKRIIIVGIIMFAQSSLCETTITNSITPVSYFVNHVSQLNMIARNLGRYNKTSVTGTSGIGKTQAVRMYAQENRSRYNIIWFFDCSLDINSEFVKLAQRINTQERKNIISEEESNAKREVMQYLSEKNKWLLVFDNNKTKQNHKIVDIVNWENNGHIIFCSQDNELLPHIIKMTAFNKKSSIELANNILEDKEEGLSEFLAEEFKGYPVLIVQGAQLLNNVRGLSKDVYKKQVLESADKVKLNVKLALDALPLTGKKLLHKIALINNLGFSKKLLTIISDNKESLDNDLYQLSKFMLISNIELDGTDPIFEMHDIIAIKVLELNSDTENKEILEDIVIKLMKAIPESVHEGHIFRTARTVHENLEVIFMNVEKYKPNIYKLMEFNLMLVTDYINTLNYSKAEPLVDWFEEKNGTNFEFKLRLMNSHEKYIYSRYLGAVGGYHRLRNHDNNKAITYLLNAKEVLDTIEGHYDIKSNTIYQLAMAQIAAGNLEAATKNIQIMENMFLNGLIKQTESGLIHLAKAKLLNAEGDFIHAIKEVNSAISETIECGLKEDDLIFSSTYLLKSEILNYLQRYQEALVQANVLHGMYKSCQNEQHEIFGRIYVQIARAKLGLKDYDTAIKYAENSIKILSRSKVEVRLSNDIELAKAYLVYADILLAMHKYKESISCYEVAEGIYRNVYTKYINHKHDIARVIFGGAKAACYSKDKFWYKHFYTNLRTIVTSKDDRIKELDNLCNSMWQ